MKITEEISRAAYPVAKQVYENKLSKLDAVDYLVKEYAMNPTSATDYINVFCQLMDGVTYKRSQNGYSIEYRLECIYRDYGLEQLRKALSSLEQHIAYNEQISRNKSRRHNLRAIWEKFSKITG